MKPKVGKPSKKVNDPHASLREAVMLHLKDRTWFPEKLEAAKIVLSKVKHLSL